MNINQETVVGKVHQETMDVNIVQVAGMKGYKFNAVDKESLRLATKLAVSQTQGTKFKIRHKN